MSLGGPEGLESAASVHREPSQRPDQACSHTRRCNRVRALLFAYDDGNGLWITSGETPSDLRFLGCICPQE